MVCFSFSNYDTQVFYWLIIVGDQYIIGTKEACPFIVAAKKEETASTIQAYILLRSTEFSVWYFHKMTKELS